MNSLKENRITKEEFLKIKEEDVMFITNPGRMGDEDGSTFVVREKDCFCKYRVDGWMYPNRNLKREECIPLNEFEEHFPKWHEAWKNCKDDHYHGKYKYYYMGFGNGLCVDYSIYDEYKPYLEKFVQDYLDSCEGKDKSDLQYAAIYNVWENALLKMMEDKEL